VALTGAAIYEAVLEEFRFPELRVTTHGLRYAALLAGD
jgi:exopolyphosphatase/pppGpp-phosphohydrolase